MVDLLISGRVYLCKAIGVTHSTSNGTFRSWRVSFLFRPCSLLLFLGCGESGHDFKGEWKLTLRDDVLLALVLREDDVQATKWLDCD